MSSSMAAAGSRLCSTPRNFHTAAASAGSMSSSSLRVPVISMSMAGKMRLSARRLSRRISMLPVPLNSSKITSSMREPVSTRAVARMVSEPPSSMLRAAPKNFLGGYRAVLSTPPERMRPLAGVLRLKARAMRVMESSSTTTSRPISTRRLTRSSTSSVTCTWCSLGWSKVLDTTVPITERCMSVTSSGRSSTSSTKRSTSGLLADGVGQLLEDRGLAGLRRRDDQAALALADGAQQVHDARGRVVLLGLEAQALLGEERRELLEHRAPGRHLGVDAVDGVDLEQRVVLLVVFGLAYLAEDLVAAPQAEAADLAERHVHVAVALGEAVGAQEAETVRQYVEDAGAGDGRAVVARLLPRLVAVAVAAAAVLAFAAALLLTLLSLVAGLRAGGPLAVAGGRVGGRRRGRVGRGGIAGRPIGRRGNGRRDLPVAGKGGGCS